MIAREFKPDGSFVETGEKKEMRSCETCANYKRIPTYTLVEVSQDGQEMVAESDSLESLTAGRYSFMGTAYKVVSREDGKTVWRSEPRKTVKVEVQVT